MVDAVELKGKDLLQLFEVSASKFGTGGFLQVSGNFLLLFMIIEQLLSNTVVHRAEYRDTVNYTHNRLPCKFEYDLGPVVQSPIKLILD